jgi:uncharacterized integral membrane protein (TIGR00697 family)
MMMSASDKTYTTLCALFSVLVVMSNLIYQKFVHIPFTSLELSAGTVLYPLSFLVTALVTEFFGKDRARYSVKLAIGMSLFIAVAIAFMDALPATSWSKIDNHTFNKVFGLYNVAFIGSLMACYITQVFDIYVYLWVRKLTGDKWLWLRNNTSTAISLLLDTTIVISFMSFFGVLPIERMGALIGNSFLFKLFFTLCSTPLFYGGYYLIQYVLGSDHKPNELDKAIETAVA